MPDIYIDTAASCGGNDGSTSNPYCSWTEAWEAEDGNIDPGETWNFFFQGGEDDAGSVPQLNDGIPTTATNDAVNINFLPWATEFGAATAGDGTGWYSGTANFSTSHYRWKFTQTGGSDNRDLQKCEGDTNTGARPIIFKYEGLQIASASSRSTRLFGFFECTEVHLIGNRINWLNVNNVKNPEVVEVKHAEILVFKCKNNLYVMGDDGSPASYKGYIVTSVSTACVAHLYNNTSIAGSQAAFSINQEAGTMTAKMNVARSDDIGELDIAGTVTKAYNANEHVASRGTSPPGLDCDEADFTTFGVGDADISTPSSSQTNDWDDMDLTNADDSEVPTIDIRRNTRNTAADTNTSAGCFAKSGEGAVADVGFTFLPPTRRQPLMRF